MDVKQMLSQMQNQFAKTQEMLEKLIVQSEVGGENRVFLKMNGKFKVLELKISFIPATKEDVEILEDMMQKAINDCTTEIEKSVKKFAM